jgi:hypothetical protein
VCPRDHIPKPAAAPIDHDDDLAIVTAAVCHASSSLDDCPTVRSSPPSPTAVALPSLCLSLQ